MHKIIIIATAAALTAGCATKDFGRIESARSTATMTCGELADAQAEVDAFRASIDKKDNFDARSLIAVTLLDFGYGNMRDKQKALASADVREAEIATARRANGC